MSNSASPTAHPPVDDRGRRIHDMRNITKTLLLDIGFSEDDYTNFKDDCEQLCGQNSSALARADTVLARQQLYQLAQRHLFARWNQTVDRGVQDYQQKRFWNSIMSQAWRNYTAKADTNTWMQRKYFRDPTQSTAAANAPIHTSSATGPRTTTTSTQGTPLRRANHQSPPPALLLRPEGPAPPRGDWHKLRGPSSLTWREVQVRVSWKYAHSDIRPLNVPLIRCVYADQRARDEDSYVAANWLDLNSLLSLIRDHVVLNPPTSSTFDPAQFVPYLSLGDSIRRLRDSNDLHLAYNMWVQQTGRTRNLVCVLMLPVNTHDDADSDLPDYDDPFGSLPPAIGVKRTVPDSHDNDANVTNKRPRIVGDDDDDDDDDGHDGPVSLSHDDDDPNNVNDDPDDSGPEDDDLYGGSRPPRGRSTTNQSNDVNMRDPEHPVQSIERKPASHSPATRTRIGSGDHPDTPPRGSGLGSRQPTPAINPQASPAPSDGSLGAGDSADRLLNTGDYEVFRRGDEEHYTIWRQGDGTTAHPGTDGDNDDGDDRQSPDYNRHHHQRPARFNDEQWLRSAGFANTAQDGNDRDGDDGDGNSDGDGGGDGDGDGTQLDSQLDQLAIQVANNRALEQFHPEMWSTIAKFLMVSEDTRFNVSYQFPIPGANPRATRSPGQMFGNVWMKLNETKVMGGILADQVGSGKTRSAIAAAVADRAYINRMWSDWEDDKDLADSNAKYVRRHLPEWDQQTGTQRCPSAKIWRYQCVCEAWGVTRHVKPKKGATVVFASPSAMQPWIDEFQKLFEEDPTDTSQGRYRNRGFGQRHGFVNHDRSPFRLVICHDAVARNYNGRDGRPNYTIRPGDKELMYPVEHPTGHLEPDNYTDRVIFLTTLQSYENNLQAKLQQTISKQVQPPARRGRRTVTQNVPIPDFLRYGTFVVDEAHQHRSTPPLFRRLIKTVRGDGTDYTSSMPYLWLVSGTPFTADVFRDVGQVWVGLWETLCQLEGDFTPWTDRDSWMAGFDRASMAQLIRMGAQTVRGSRGDRRTHRQIRTVRTQYLTLAIKFASRLIIQRSENTRIQGHPTTTLPDVDRNDHDVTMTAGQQTLVDSSWRQLSDRAGASWRAATNIWQQNGSRGPAPRLERYLQSEARSLPVVRASTSFPELQNVVQQYQVDTMAQLDRDNPHIPQHNKPWASLSMDDRTNLCTLRLSIDEIAHRRWDRLEQERSSPYHVYNEMLMDNCPKKNVLDNFWDQVAGSQNKDGQNDKAVVMTCSPVASLIVYHYFKYGCNNAGSKYHRNTRPMNCHLLTSKNYSNADKNTWIQKFNDIAPPNDKFQNHPAPDILICTTGTFGTGQNCGRARYALVLEPQPSLSLSIQCAGRIRRAGYTEQVHVWDIVNRDSRWEQVQKARNEDHNALMAMIQQFEREAMATDPPTGGTASTAGTTQGGGSGAGVQQQDGGGPSNSNRPITYPDLSGLGQT